MGREDIGAAEGWIIERLRARRDPISARELLVTRVKDSPNPLLRRTALWRLVDRGTIEFTPDRRVRLKDYVAARVRA